MDTLKSKLDNIDELRRRPQQTDAEVIAESLAFRVEMRDRIIPRLMSMGPWRGLPLWKLADVLDTKYLPVEAETTYSVGED